MDKKPTRYSALMRYAHWLTALAIVVAYVLINVGEEEDSKGGSTPSLVLQGHYLAGLVVLVLLVPRVWSLVRTHVPPIVPTPGKLLAYTARGTHLALYAFLLVQPVLGVLQVNYSGELVSLPWVDWSLPALVGPDHGAHEFVAELHEVLGEIFYWVIGAHIFAALWHHYGVRDNTLRRML